MGNTRKIIFVTVGTTVFDDLIQTALSPVILQALSLRGYNEMILQIGRSTIVPDCTPRDGFNNIEYFQLKASISEYIESTDLVISHAGAGSILDALDARKNLIVVTNERLMSNHQLELAEQLYKDEHLYHCTCDTLLNVIHTMDFAKLKPFVNNKSKRIADFINSVMGFGICEND